MSCSWRVPLKKQKLPGNEENLESGMAHTNGPWWHETPYSWIGFVSLYRVLTFYSSGGVQRKRNRYCRWFFKCTWFWPEAMGSQRLHGSNDLGGHGRRYTLFRWERKEGGFEVPDWTSDEGMLRHSSIWTLQDEKVLEQMGRKRKRIQPPVKRQKTSPPKEKGKKAHAVEERRKQPEDTATSPLTLSQLAYVFCWWR